MRPGIFLWLILVVSMDVRAQSVPRPDSARPDSARPFHHDLYNPAPLECGESVLNIGGAFSLLPAPIVLQEIPAPTLDIQYKRGLSPEFSLFGNFSTNYFTNVLIAGIQYNTGLDDWSFAAGNAIAGFAGYMDLGGEFDKNTAAAVATIPMLRVGHTFEHASVSLMVAADYVLYSATKIGAFEDRGLSSHFNDIFFTIAFEQPFYRNQRVSTGLSITYSRTPYQIWIMYNIFDQYLVIPEFFFSFQIL
jgi:hypothetical protein